MTQPTDARYLLEKLVSFPTVSRDSNLDLVEWAEAFLTGIGARCFREMNAEGTKANLYAHIGPDIEGGVILSGHTDVVPVDGQAWSTDPFTVVEKDGKLFGRGCCDMKGFDALAMAAAAKAAKMPLKRPLQVCLSRDEEIGCTGAPPMIERILETLPQASAVIVGEPSMMKAVSGHKGGIGITTTLVGHEVHSSLIHQGVNAIMFGAKLVDWANKVNAENMARSPGPVAQMFDPPFSTAHVGTIRGGTAENITAKECHFIMGFRVLPDENMADYEARYLQQVRAVEAQMQAIHPDAHILTERRFDVPGLRPEAEGEAEVLVRAVTGDNASHKVSYGTEAGQFQERGYSAVICGPGNIDQAHQADEYISVAQFQAGHAFMQKLLQRLAH